MTYKYVCDHCKQIIDRNINYVHVDYYNNIESKYFARDFHIDCFNYKFSTDIRKIEET